MRPVDVEREAARHLIDAFVSRAHESSSRRSVSSACLRAANVLAKRQQDHEERERSAA